MLLYCVAANNTEAVTVGCNKWFDVATFEEAEVLSVCRPFDVKRVPAFDVYINELKAKGAVYYALEKDLPEGIKRRQGYWESKGWK